VRAVSAFFEARLALGSLSGSAPRGRAAPCPRRARNRCPMRSHALREQRGKGSATGHLFFGLLEIFGGWVSNSPTGGGMNLPRRRPPGQLAFTVHGSASLCNWHLGDSSCETATRQA
jgi:hypothetical protein